METRRWTKCRDWSPRESGYPKFTRLVAGVSAQYLFTHYPSLWGSYVYEDRDSLHQCSYTTNIDALSLVLVFLISVEHRPDQGTLLCGTVRS